MICALSDIRESEPHPCFPKPLRLRELLRQFQWTQQRVLFHGNNLIKLALAYWEFYRCELKLFVALLSQGLVRRLVKITPRIVIIESITNWIHARHWISILVKRTVTGSCFLLLIIFIEYHLPPGVYETYACPNHG